MPNDYTPQDILLTQMEENSLKAETIGQFLACLTRDIFSRHGLYGDKNAFIQNTWEEDLAYALVLHGHIDGVISEDAELKDFDATQFTDALGAALTLLHDADYSTLALPPEPTDHYLLEFSAAGDIVDQVDQGFTKKDAEDLLKSKYSSRYDKGWRIVHIPAVT